VRLAAYDITGNNAEWSVHTALRRSPRPSNLAVRLGKRRSAKLLFVASLVFAPVNPTQAAIRIAGDRGGQIGKYLDRYDAIRTSGETVIIDGQCLSACTMVLGAVPQAQICVTSHANLGFHAAYDLGAKGRAVTNTEATQLLYSHYSLPVRDWITARGGLKSQMIFLRGKELMNMYRPCDVNAERRAADWPVGRSSEFQSDRRGHLNGGQ
jgi:hypothetical protein